MEKNCCEVKWHDRAYDSLQKIYLYIYKRSPQNADNFTDRLIEFGNSLGIIHEKFQICRQKSYYKRKIRCAVFEKNYIFIYKFSNNYIVLHNIVHASKIR